MERMNEQEQEKLLRKYLMRNKDRLLIRIKNCIKDMVVEDSMTGEHSKAYYKRLNELLERFYEKVKKIPLMTIKDDCWGYGFCITEWGVVLSLMYVDVDYDITEQDEKISFPLPFYEYKLMQVDAKMLSPEEYAEVYEVGTGTVRQWIRRGKLRSAKKIGRTWKISELCDMPSRGYTPASYAWKEHLEDLPEEYEYLNKYKRAEFFGRATEIGKYTVIFDDPDGIELPYKLKLTMQEREKLELILISHPQIECEETYIHSFLWEEDYEEM